MSYWDGFVIISVSYIVSEALVKIACAFLAMYAVKYERGKLREEMLRRMGIEV